MQIYFEEQNSVQMMTKAIVPKAFKKTSIWRNVTKIEIEISIIIF